MKLLCPEVVQTSAMDCGPASLKSLLDGFGVPVSYGRLREACQTDVDGSSIDTLEEVARDLGLDAEQEMVPADHLLDPAADVLPAIVIVRLPNGFTHFVVVWRRHGPFVQVMDPASGRRWMRRESFLRDVYRHAMPVAAADWRAWAASGQGLDVVTARLRRLGVRGDALIAAALGDPGWRPLAALDAAARATDRLRRAGALTRGAEAEAVLRGLLERGGAAVPPGDWSAAVAPAAADGTEQVQLRGAVFVRVRGLLPRAGPGPSAAPDPSGRPDEAADGAAPAPARRLSPDLAAALIEPPARPGLDLLRLLRQDGLVQPAFVLGGLALASIGAVVEAMLFRRFIDIGRALGLFAERLALAGVVSWLLVGLLLLRLPVLAGVLGIGRRLEVRLRVAFLAKIPRLGDRYLASRPTSDMAERSHSMYQLRTLPQLGQQVIGTATELAVTTAGLVWLAPRSAWVAVTAAALQIGLPLALQKPLTERDLRVRIHEGSLTRFYLDAMLGLMAVRTHGAERALGREHGSLLDEWKRASRSFLRTTVVIEGLQAMVGLVVGAALLASYLGGGADAAGTLLLVHWALGLPALGQELALAARQYPMLRNLTLRLVEPLGARDDGDGENAAPSPPDAAASPAPLAGVALSLRGVGVVAAGHTILEGLDLEIAAGEHLAVVGASGAGKSTLAGLLLGWHRAHAGTVTVDGHDLDGVRLRSLRRETAWVDPAVQLWNRSLIDNLRYGATGEGGEAALDVVLDAAELRRVIERLPAGAATPLGEGGGLVSGGEGQRVRFGRALLRPDARLVILDEAFRGLERAQRRALYARTRALWPGATILCITHDVAETLDFPRVLVIEGGHLVEDGPPAALRVGPSRYRAMLESEDALNTRVWRSPEFRTLEVVDGYVRDEGAPA